MTPTTI